jgi:hypothetical protein
MSRRPPKVAKWLVELALSGSRGDPLIGDLDEQFARGRSAAWYWRQASHAVSRRIVRNVSEERFLSLRGLFASLVFFVTWSYAVMRIYQAVTWAWRIPLRRSPVLRTMWLMYGTPELILLCSGAAFAGWLAARLAQTNKTAVVWLCAVLQLPLFANASRAAWTSAHWYTVTPPQSVGLQIVAVVLLVGMPLSTVIGGALASRRDRFEFTR